MTHADGTNQISTTNIMPRIANLKADVDVLLRQLSEGEYLTVDTFASNWIQLIRQYEKIQVQMNDRAVMDRVTCTDLLLTADLLTLVRIIRVLKGFLRCGIIPR